jgi:methionyl-tRNA formyltransferase
MGTPEFAVEPLRAIIEAGYDVAAVVTAPDKPAGRGQKLHASPVKEYALQQNLPVLQPVNLKNPDFVNELKSFNANLQVVVAFRMLPEVVWQMPEYGTLNLHASLLPQYR